MQTMSGGASRVVVAALYRFAEFPDFRDFREPLLELMRANEVRGTLLLAAEGINGTIAGSREGVDRLIAWLERDERFSGLAVKESLVDENPFYRGKVKLKKEIVTMGVDGVDPNHLAGTYVEPRDWNALISDPQVLLLDTRNRYEVEIGSFAGAVNPGTDSFREFPDYASKNLDPARHRKIAMFCTGGIRCEKATAYLKQQGFDEVYHLRGGILQYLAQVPEQQSQWRGECFVFDNRVTVNHQLEKGRYDQCHACRRPITEEDKQSEHYRKGISCHHCHGRHSPEKRGRYAERQRQVELARQRGEEHLGQPMTGIIAERRRGKLRFKERQRRQERAKTQTQTRTKTGADNA